MYPDLTNRQPVPFASFVEDDLAELDAAVAVPAADEPVVYMDKCPKCKGTGSYGRWTRLGHSRCTKCNGTGTLPFKTSPEERANRRASSANRRNMQAEAWEQQFAVEYPDIAKWMQTTGTEFAQSLREAVRKYGALTERQLAAAQRGAFNMLAAEQRATQRAEEQRVQVAAAPVHDMGALEAAFARAKSTGLQRPAITLAGFRVSEAPANGRNPGALYVKAEGVYLGKVAGGKFLAGRDCDAATTSHVNALLADPLGTVLAHGKLTGRCAICNRQLTDPQSVDRGIGPICAEKFGW